MVFSSLTFLFMFLPVTLILYYISPKKLRNSVLLLASLIFYAWGEPKYVVVMLISILGNYIFGLLVGYSKEKKQKIFLILSVIFNIGMLGVFKYTGFFVENVRRLFGANPIVINIALPLGISFFTFQAMSYVIDVYRNDAKVQRNPLDLALYISLFPQLVAGPIVRYQTVADQIEERKTTIEQFGEGINRFVIGVAKKVIIANQLAPIAESAFNGGLYELTVASAWIGIIAFSLQIFFDFSGYSDMAIGLGKMFGFEFLENFNYPYISKSASEFWRRWHISLGSWFRDYVYIPLGGNRVSKIKVYRNLFVVWFLTGFWHGANWNFIGWGLLFGVLIAIEKAFLNKLFSRIWSGFSHIYLLLVVMIGWVFFQSKDMSSAIEYIKCMFGLGNTSLYDGQTIGFLNDYWLVLILAIIFSMPVLKFLKERIQKINVKILDSNIFYCINSVVLILLLGISTLLLVTSTYNPFLYFRF